MCVVTFANSVNIFKMMVMHINDGCNYYHEHMTEFSNIVHFLLVNVMRKFYKQILMKQPIN